MASFTVGRFVTVAAATAAGVMLAACNANTYGTGTPPGLQTIKDVAGITSLSGEKKEPIDYNPRPSVVLPPATAGLPPPSNGDGALAADWPVDPDEQVRKLKADVAALAAEGKTLDFRLPTGATQPQDPYAGLTDKERAALVKKLAAQASSTVAVDENGNPIRRYLSEPPVEYRQGDPDAPVLTADEMKKEKKKNKKWWQFWASN